MILLSAQHIQKSFGGNTVLRDASLVLQDGNPIMAVGSPGSLAIPPAVATIINNVLLYGMNVQQAINEPRAMAINRSGMDSPARVSI